jgi:hypothetical protein
MWKDPIVAEIHRARRAIFARFDHDMDAYFQHLKELEEQERARGRTIIEAPLHRPQQVGPNES